MSIIGNFYDYGGLPLLIISETHYLAFFDGPDKPYIEDFDDLDGSPERDWVLIS